MFVAIEDYGSHGGGRRWISYIFYRFRPPVRNRMSDLYVGYFPVERTGIPHIGIFILVTFNILCDQAESLRW